MSDSKRRAAYRRLLRLFPPTFREDHAHDMERVFMAMVREWEAERGGVGVRFWATLTWDVAVGASREWMMTLGRGIRSATAMTMGEHMSALWGDVRFAIRQLVRQPVYALTIVFLMALGIAGNAAVFRVVNGLFIKPLPFDEPEQLVDLNETAPSWDLEYLQIAYRDFHDWREHNSTFQAMSAISYGGGNLAFEGGAQRVSFLRTTHDMDEVLRLAPVIGRFYGPEEDHPDGPRAALITQGFWEQQFGSDPDVIGTTMSLDGFPVEIIGVLPPEARFVGDVEMWLPLREQRSDFEGWGLQGIGRLKPDVTIEQAYEDLLAIHKGMIPEFEVNEISSPTIESLRDRFLGDYRLGSGFLMAAVGIVLLIACANIAGLMFARSLARGPEMGVRLALGAPRGRIVRQLLTESFVLAGVGAGLGLLLGTWGSNALVTPLADQFPRWVVFDLDARFVGFTVAITVAAAVLFGLAPALQASSGNSRITGARTTRSISRRRGMSALVSGEVALAMMLLIVAGLTVLDVRRLGQVDPGFEAEGLVYYSLSLPTQRYPDVESRSAFFDEYMQRVAAIPGVESAALSTAMPLAGHWGWFFMVDGAPPRAEEEANPVVLNRVVTPSYFETAGVEFAAGRGFDDFDGREEGSQVIIVNETFVRTHLSHLDNPIGARVTPGTGEPDEDETWMTVIGVTRDVKHYGVDEPMRPGVYQPLRQLPRAGGFVALRIRGDSEPVLAQARTLTADMDVELPVYDVHTMTEDLDQALYTRRASSWLIAAFSTVALLLSIAGIYGVISYSVGQRRQEIGIRLAMGAERHDVLGQVVRQGMALVAVGAVVGLVLTFAGAGVIEGILVDVSGREPLVYAGVTLMLVAVAAAANYVPARRASRLDPMGVLRDE